MISDKSNTSSSSSFEIFMRVNVESPLTLAANDLLSKNILTTSQTSRLFSACSSGKFSHQSLCILKDGLAKLYPKNETSTQLLDLIKQSSAKPTFDRNDIYLENDKIRLEKEQEKVQKRLELSDRQAHREYAELTSSIRRVEEKNSLAAGFKLYSQQMSIGMSLLLTLISAVLLGFFAGRQMFGVDRPGAALIVAAIAGTSLFIVEAILMITRLSRVDAKTHNLKKEQTMISNKSTQLST
jgi:hypothetical protein